MTPTCPLICPPLYICTSICSISVHTPVARWRTHCTLDILAPSARTLVHTHRSASLPPIPLAAVTYTHTRCRGPVLYIPVSVRAFSDLLRRRTPFNRHLFRYAVLSYRVPSPPLACLQIRPRPPVRLSRRWSVLPQSTNAHTIRYIR